MDEHQNPAHHALLLVLHSLRLRRHPQRLWRTGPRLNRHTRDLVTQPVPASAPTDRELAERVYQDRQRIPVGFYTDTELPTASGSSTTHLKTTYELCTDDWNEALAWSEDAAHRMPVYSPLTETNANNRYFEFVRARPQPEGWLERQRVFRCTYLDRTGTDRTQLHGYGGILHGDAPALTTPADVKQLIEYLWQFTLFNNYGNAVLSTEAHTAGDAHQHTLTLITLTRATSPDLCDRFDILHWTHAININTGIIDRHLEPIRSFFARESAGTATECSH